MLLLPHPAVVLKRVLRVFALFAFAGAAALDPIVVAFAVFLEAIGFLAVAGPLRPFHFDVGSQTVLVLVVVFAVHAFTQLIASSSFIIASIPWVKH